MDKIIATEAIDEAAVANAVYLEQQYRRYQDQEQALDPSWQKLFSACDSQLKDKPFVQLAAGDALERLIEAYRTFGHFKAKTNPLASVAKQDVWQLDLKEFGFSEADLKRKFSTRGLLPQSEATLAEIIARLENIYCGSVGVEYKGLGNPALEKWLQDKIEGSGFQGNMSIEQKKMILQYLNKSELLEIFLHTKYTGQKRFSLEGGETLIPMIAAIIDKLAEESAEEFFIGMAHRGRLNVLSNIMNKSYSLIFSEFDENSIPDSFELSGDVKYHKGFFSESISTHGHKVQVVLTPNPSHLEAVAPVIEGQTFAKQLIFQNGDGKKKVVPILIHGDAALCGQGVVYETLQLQSLEGYGTGGTIHLVINNQVGFTTLPKDYRSTHYCTDIAHTFGAPIFHVNGEDPEQCVYAAYLAAEIRQKFQCDVFIDLVCYRKYGHNESDEPAFTQPQEYLEIGSKKSVREIYRDDLIRQGVVEKELSEELETEFKLALQEELQFLKTASKKNVDDLPLPLPEEKTANFAHIPTGVSLGVLKQIAEVACRVPNDFSLHPKLNRLLSDRLAMLDNSAKPVDWGMAEMLAIGSLLWEGVGVRLSGQDCCRGTFSHRHAVWTDQKKQLTYCALQHLKSGQGRFEVYNSSLSEYAVLGFEYGYSIANPDVLVMWEAQFGDFCNGAQIIIDQFISTGEQKWGQQSGLTLLLPHGYEGQGPEHSSARMERYLTLAGQNNMRIVNASTPAQFFHLLRRQQLTSDKKPLIVFTPKALLRHPACVSKIEEFVLGSFQEILDDPEVIENVQEIILCTGHVYYDLIAERQKLKAEKVAIIRVEQLYPFDRARMQAILNKYEGFKRLTWVQEEPKNMGAAVYMTEVLREVMPQGTVFSCYARPRSASPAAGSYALHKKQLANLLSDVFNKQQPSIFEIAGQTKSGSEK